MNDAAVQLIDGYPVDRDAQAITHIAMLNASEPWLAVQVPGQPVTFIPQVEEVMDMFDPIEVSDEGIQILKGLGTGVMHSREALLIEDIDELLNAEDPEAFVLAEIQDQSIINRRNINTVAAINALQGELGDLEALSREFSAEVEKPIEGEAMAKLPTNWAKGWNQTEEQQKALLATLNSAFS